MVLTCYHCHLPFTPTLWNPFRVTLTCPQLCCGRAVYLGEAVEGMYGKRVGKLVSGMIQGLERVGHHGRENLTPLAELTRLRVEKVLADAERDAADPGLTRETLKKMVSLYKGPAARPHPTQARWGRALEPLPGEVFGG